MSYLEKLRNRIPTSQLEVDLFMALIELDDKVKVLEAKHELHAESIMNLVARIEKLENKR